MRDIIGIYLSICSGTGSTPGAELGVLVVMWQEFWQGR